MNANEQSRRISVITPVPVPAAAQPLFRAQVPPECVRPGTTLEFSFAREGGHFLDSHYDSALATAFVLEQAEQAEADGCDAVCISTMTDTGLDAVRSRLTIPVVGAGLSSYLLACNLGERFSVVTLWQRWVPFYLKSLKQYCLDERLASVRHINTHPNLEALLTGKEEVVFAALEQAARQAIEDDGADVIVLGSTTMYQSHRYLAQKLAVPVVNPALVGVQACENLLDLSLSHSKACYVEPEFRNDGLLNNVLSRF
ncbi:aspartate/glutamate racemase family protein [Denitratisoma sp. DHT3]|uniref:aspartate/glutamate racemase family protein n=1 Tax=Denitratisoma sp. DHT3 TaxID=1981880 RepID=UPI0011A46378|nr:aspartate/glutamate racemase family protein [Denitratisoma sp. DHT3]